MEDLTPAQMLFAAMSQNQYYEIMLAPYIDHTPSEEELLSEAQMMYERGQKYRAEGKNFYGKNLFEWDGKGDPYDS